MYISYIVTSGLAYNKCVESISFLKIFLNTFTADYNRWIKTISLMYR